jgi:hypothetical protein
MPYFPELSILIPLTGQSHLLIDRRREQQQLQLRPNKRFCGDFSVVIHFEKHFHIVSTRERIGE